MPRPLDNRLFDPKKPVVVRRAFTGSGRHYQPGDDFPWQRLAVDRRRVSLLFESGVLDHPTPETWPEYTPEEEPASGTLDTVPAPVTEVAEKQTFFERDELDDIDSMTELRRIADKVGAPYKVSKIDQRAAIRIARMG